MSSSQAPSLLSRRPQLLMLLGVVALLGSPACSDEEEAPAPQPEFALTITDLDGYPADGEVPLGCSNIAVSVAISSSLKNVSFLLRPANACGASKRCGYVKVEGLSASDEVLASVDTVTTTGLLPLDEAARPALAKVRVSLVSGVDQTVIKNKAGEDVVALVEPTFALETGCDEKSGGGGAGGAGGGAGTGGADGGNGGASDQGGASTGGASASGAGGAAAGQGGTSELGGAPQAAAGAAP